MANKKITRRALVMSVISLVLCCAMLVGTTFAWFTDSVTSTNNIIKSGTLDVEMWYSNDGSSWADASTGAIFNHEHWEPGYTDVKYIEISNKGNLAFKFQLNILPVSDPVAGEVNLADVIDVYLLENTVTREDVNAATPVGTLAQLMSDPDGAAYGIMLPASGSNNVADLAPEHEAIAKTGTAKYTIALKMQETAGNDYQNKSVGGGFSVQLLATQYTYENDSFDNEYDEDLEILENGIEHILDDGSTVMYYSEDSGYFGRVRLSKLPENVGSEYVVPAEVNDLGGALVGADLDKLTIPADVEYAYKSLENATIDEVIIKDGATTIPNRMFYKANVSSIKIPDSVTVIEQNAFSMTAGVTELVIPASVTTVEEAAFQHMDNLVKVTFEGNTAIQGYAFRGCAKLHEVYLNGNDVRFIASTLSNKNSAWFCNGESNNPNTSDIDFYVVNETVAARVKTAMGAEANNTDVYVNGKKYVTSSSNSQDGLNSAMGNASGNVVDVTLSSGDYTLPSASNADVTISGTKETVITINTPNYSGSDVTFEGVTVKGSGFATGVQHVDTVTYTSVTIVGDMCLYGEKVVFNSCTFELDGQYIWTYGAKEVEFNNCTFNTTGKAILIYNEGAGASNVSVKNCTFNASTGAMAGAIANQNCAAIEIDNFQSSGTGAAHTLTTSGNTYNSNFSGEWRIKSYTAGNAVTVNGVQYTQIAVDGKLMTIDADKNVTVQ